MPLLDSNAAVSSVSVRRESIVATTMMFRTFCLTTAVIVSGCATQHNSPQSPLSAASAPNVSPAAAAAAPRGDAEARRMAAEAKKLNLEVVKKDGEVRFCRSNVVTGSRFQKDRQCYTAEQVEVMQGQTQQSGSQ
jgi:hypothetical protein